MPFPTNIQNLATRIATEFKAIRTLISGSGTGGIGGLNTTDKSSLVSAINEVYAKPSGGATNLDGLSDVAVVNPATGHLLRHNGTEFVNVLGTDHYQAADSDLLAIAALTTTAYGRAFLTLADQAALMGLVPESTETVAGKQRVATPAETTAGTLDNVTVSPLKLQQRLSAYAQPLDTDLTAIAALATTAYGRAFLTLADQAALTALLPLDSDTSLAANSNTKIATQAAVKAYADSRIAAQDAMVFKGVIDASGNPNYPAADRGHTYRVSVAGKIGGAAGVTVEVGDLVLCVTDNSAANTQANVGANWTVIQTNIDGAVTGPVSASNNALATFNGTSGKVIQDSAVFISTDGAMASNVDTKLPTEKAVRTYTYSKSQVGDPETNYVTAFEAALT